MPVSHSGGGSRDRRELTDVAIVHPDAVAVVAAPALHDVVGIIRLGHFVVGVNDNLEPGQEIKSADDADAHVGHLSPAPLPEPGDGTGCGRHWAAERGGLGPCVHLTVTRMQRCAPVSLLRAGLPEAATVP